MSGPIGSKVATIAMPTLTERERQLGLPPHGVKLLYLMVDDAGKASLQDDAGKVIDVQVDWHGARP